MKNKSKEYSSWLLLCCIGDIVNTTIGPKFWKVGIEFNFGLYKNL